MLGISQTKLADTLGITFQQVQKYEKGVNRISASRLQHIANVLQVSILFFFDGFLLPTAQEKKSTARAHHPRFPLSSPRPKAFHS